MADSSTPRRTDEPPQDPGQETSEIAHSASQGTTEQESRKGKAALVTPELVREELVESAVSFLKHPKVVSATDAQRRSFLEKKGLTVDEIDEAFRRLLSPSSNLTSSNTCRSQGESDHSCRITQVNEIATKCIDDSGRHDPETEPVIPRHPKSYMEIMEMIQRGERPDDIQNVNDDPPNPDQPISESRLAPKPKPWEKQGQGSSSLNLKSQSSSSSESSPEVQHDITNQATGSSNNSNKGDLLLLAETVDGAEAPADDAVP